MSVDIDNTVNIVLLLFLQVRQTRALFLYVAANIVQAQTGKHKENGEVFACNE